MSCQRIDSEKASAWYLLKEMWFSMIKSALYIRSMDSHYLWPMMGCYNVAPPLHGGTVATIALISPSRSHQNRTKMTKSRSLQLSFYKFNLQSIICFNLKSPYNLKTLISFKNWSDISKDKDLALFWPSLHRDLRTPITTTFTRMSTYILVLSKVLSKTNPSLVMRVTAKTQPITSSPIRILSK